VALTVSFTGVHYIAIRDELEANKVIRWCET